MCRCTNEKIPYFNAPVYLENKSQIGKVDDIFGPMNEFVSCTAVRHHMTTRNSVCVYEIELFNLQQCMFSLALSSSQYFSVKLQSDMQATSFKDKQKVCASAVTLQQFLNL